MIACPRSGADDPTSCNRKGEGIAYMIIIFANLKKEKIKMIFTFKFSITKIHVCVCVCVWVCARTPNGGKAEARGFALGKQANSYPGCAECHVEPVPDWAVAWLNCPKAFAVR